MKTKTGGKKREKSFVAVDVFESDGDDDDDDDFFLRLFSPFSIFFPLIPTWLVDSCVCYCARMRAYLCVHVYAGIHRSCVRLVPTRAQTVRFSE